MAGRQGKLHSAPFHTESHQYKYAIENENKGYEVKHELPACKYFNIATKKCSLWNSGQDLCASYKCGYYREELQKDRTCNECAYCWNKKCVHKRCSHKNSNKKLHDASYCSYFISEAMSSEKYNRIRQKIQIASNKAYAAKLHKRIESKKSAIRSFTKQLKAEDLSDAEQKYLNQKIEAFKHDLDNSKRQLSAIEAKEVNPPITRP